VSPDRPDPAPRYWCPRCRCEPSDVTYEEHCADCGCSVVIPDEIATDLRGLGFTVTKPGREPEAKPEPEPTGLREAVERVHKQACILEAVNANKTVGGLRTLMRAVAQLRAALATEPAEVTWVEQNPLRHLAIRGNTLVGHVVGGCGGPAHLFAYTRLRDKDVYQGCFRTESEARAAVEQALGAEREGGE